MYASGAVPSTKAFRPKRGARSSSFECHELGKRETYPIFNSACNFGQHCWYHASFLVDASVE